MEKGQQRGFALGLVLLAVVLIGAVAAAIASSTGSSANLSQVQKNRIAASALLSQANDIKTNLSMAESDGYEVFRLARTDPDCPATAFCLYNDDTGYGMPPQVPQSMAMEDAQWEWGTVQVQMGGQDLGSSSGEIVIALAGIHPAVCSQINNILNDDVPDAYNNAADNGSPITTTASLSSTTGVNVGTISLDDTYRAGCFEDDGADPSGDNDYTYVDVVKVN